MCPSSAGTEHEMGWAERQLRLIVSPRPHQRMLTTGFTAVISCPGDRESDSNGTYFQPVSGNRYTWKGGAKSITMTYNWTSLSHHSPPPQHPPCESLHPPCEFQWVGRPGTQLQPPGTQTQHRHLRQIAFSHSRNDHGVRGCYIKYYIKLREGESLPTFGH